MEPDRQRVGQDCQLRIQTVGQAVALTGMGVKDLGESPR
jgi:hypothetical protein